MPTSEVAVPGNGRCCMQAPSQGFTLASTMLLQGQWQQSGIQAGRTRDSVRAALLSLAQSDAFVDIIVEHLQRQDLKM